MRYGYNSTYLRANLPACGQTYPLAGKPTPLIELPDVMSRISRQQEDSYLKEVEIQTKRGVICDGLQLSPETAYPPLSHFH
jgi:hypothetical protein